MHGYSGLASVPTEGRSGTPARYSFPRPYRSTVNDFVMVALELLPA
jgi:hypothetical protein